MFRRRYTSFVVDQVSTCMMPDATRNSHLTPRGAGTRGHGCTAECFFFVHRMSHTARLVACCFSPIVVGNGTYWRRVQQYQTRVFSRPTKKHFLDAACTFRKKKNANGQHVFIFDFDLKINTNDEKPHLSQDSSDTAVLCSRLGA